MSECVQFIVRRSWYHIDLSDADAITQTNEGSQTIREMALWRRVRLVAGGPVENPPPPPPPASAPPGPVVTTGRVTVRELMAFVNQMQQAGGADLLGLDG